MIRFPSYPFFAFFYKNFIVLALAFFSSRSLCQCNCSLGCKYLDSSMKTNLLEKKIIIPFTQTLKECFLKNASLKSFALVFRINQLLKSYNDIINKCFFIIPPALASFKGQDIEKNEEKKYVLHNTKKLLVNIWLMLEIPEIAQKIQTDHTFKESALIAKNYYVINDDQYNFLVE